MKINTDTLLINLLLTGLSEKMLKNKYAGLPKNWKTKQALSMSLLPDPAIGMMLHQNELQKEDEKIMQLNQQKTDEGVQIIKEFLADSTIDEDIRKGYYNEIQDSLKPNLFSPDDSIPFAIVEEIPLFPICDLDASDDEKRVCFEEKIYDHIKDYTYYPEDSSSEEFTEVFVTFIIDKVGGVTDVKAHGEYKPMEEGIEELILTLPQITPGTHQGKVVRVICSISVEFYKEDGEYYVTDYGVQLK